MPITPREKLVHEIAASNTAIVVGAGVSVQATANLRPAASWLGLLVEGVEYSILWVNPKPSPHWIRSQKEALKKPTLEKLLSVASNLEEILEAPNGARYSEFLQHTVGSLRATNPPVLEAISELATMGCLVATTNYDDLLSTALKLPVTSWNDRQMVEEILRGSEKSVLHLHGHWRQPNSVVLGERSYLGVIEDLHAQTMQKLLSIGRVLVFVGFGEGLNDPNFGQMFKWLSTSLPAPALSHYRLCRYSEEETLRSKHALDHRMVVVPYGENYAELAPFLAALASDARNLRRRREKHSNPEEIEKKSVRTPPRAALRFYGKILGGSLVLTATVFLVIFFAKPSSPILPPQTPPSQDTLETKYEQSVESSLKALLLAYSGRVNSVSITTEDQSSQLSKFRASAAQAKIYAEQISVATHIPEPCEADYLENVNEFITADDSRSGDPNPTLEHMFRTIIANMEGIRSRKDVHGTECSRFDFSGPYRYSGRSHYRISDILDSRAGRVAPMPPSADAMAEWEIALKELGAAYSASPLYPDNFVWYKWALQGVLAGPSDYNNQAAREICRLFNTQEIPDAYQNLRDYIEKTRAVFADCKV